MTKIKFNSEQLEAIQHFQGAAGVIAAAGSGKSTILVERINQLINTHKVQEHNVLAITFTKATSVDLTNKLKQKNLNFVNVGTFHAICGRILAQEGVRIDGRNLIKEWQIDNCFRAIDQEADTKEILNFISYQRNYMKTYTDEFIQKESNYTTDQLREFFKAYETMKKRERLYDFDDYLLLCLDILRKNKGKYTFDYILVDEHQDSNLVQNELLKEWSMSGNIFVVGDIRQSVYSFRSGNIQYFMDFEKDWDNAKMLNVRTNYRSPKNIVEKANNFIKQYLGSYKHYEDAIAHIQEDGHIEVNTYSNEVEEGIKVVDNIEKLISNEIKLNDILVLYRVNKQSHYVENELKRRKIEYDIENNSSFFKRREIAAILSYLRLAQDLKDDNAFEQVFKSRHYPLKFFSGAIYKDIQTYARQNDISLYESINKINYPKVWHDKSVNTFMSNMRRLTVMADNDTSVLKMIDTVVDMFQMKSSIQEKYSNLEEMKERMASIEVLKSFVQNNDLEQFITYVYSSQDKKKKKEQSVKLMSIHRSKGLEFDNVFLIGVEDETFPHMMSDVEEEARLFYVATTRSKQNMWISQIGNGNRFIEEYGLIKNE